MVAFWTQCLDKLRNAEAALETYDGQVLSEDQIEDLKALQVQNGCMANAFEAFCVEDHSEVEKMTDSYLGLRFKAKRKSQAIKNVRTPILAALKKIRECRGQAIGLEAASEATHKSLITHQNKKNAL